MHDFEQKEIILSSEKELFVIGGASVYKQTLDKADRLYITLINKDYDGDIYFPEVDLSNFNLIKIFDSYSSIHAPTVSFAS